MELSSEQAARDGRDGFHVLTVGWSIDVIKRLADPLERATGFAFSHILDPSVDRSAVQTARSERFYFVRDDLRTEMPVADPELLAALERPDVPTIHNMILSDRLLRTRNYADVLSYATYLARRFEELFRLVKPSVVIGGFDGLHSGIALAVARRLEIPWFALHFTAIPLGLTAFCPEMSPASARSYLQASPQALRSLAEQTLADFEQRRLVVPAYLSANSMGMILRRLPRHFQFLLRSLSGLVKRRTDEYTQPSARQLVGQYVRKRKNLVLLKAQKFIDQPPDTPFLFFGLHMQPESSIDVWAPFFADQFAVIEAIARSTPPNHPLLVKLHKSDADNYSPRQLERLHDLPGVHLVSPYAQSRSFIEKASLVLAIQGSIAMEAALLGRPLLFFGDSRVTELPSVTRVKRVTDLPDQIRSKLAEKPPAREAIVRGLMSYLSAFGPGCSNDWEAVPAAAEIEALASNFVALRDSMEKQSSPASPAASVFAADS